MLESKIRTGTRQIKGIHNFKWLLTFVCLVPVRLLLSSTAVLYHVNGYLQRAYLGWLYSIIIINIIMHHQSSP